ncbi:hypothetical protein A2U01_0109150, partial [Trifolium medium]|nr:hypothetical protein [Trifolium medium]
VADVTASCATLFMICSAPRYPFVTVVGASSVSFFMEGSSVATGNSGTISDNG